MRPARGIGADGVLRVVRTEHMPEFAEFAGVAEFFMDYRNADGSLAEMCGNGARVFVRYLDAVGLVTDADVVIATRGGLRSTTINRGPVDHHRHGPGDDSQGARDAARDVGDRTWPATGVLVPNPHAVVFVEDLAEAGDLLTAPDVVPAAVFPDGVNVEFVVDRGPQHVAMRVHERGVGETQSCGTGACAVAWAARRRERGRVAGETTWQVDVPGGTVHVTQTPTGELLLCGPADLVARGTVLLPPDPPIGGVCVVARRGPG